MQIVNHINELLFRYECIIIPGFGAFLTHHQAAYVEKPTNNFMPPKKKLSFNRQLQTNDGLLANHLAKTYGVSYLEALQNIREQVQIWTAQIENKTPLYFSELGVLKSNDDGNWQFTSDPNNIFQAASFGLSPVGSYAISRKDISTPEQKIIPITSVEVKKEGTLKYFKTAGVAAVITVLLGLGGFSLYKQEAHEYNFVQQKIAAQQLEMQIHTASFTIANPLPAITLALPKEKHAYHVVAGAFRDFDNAEKRVIQLKEEGFEARILRENTYGLHEVVYNSFSTRKDAINELRRIKQSHNQNAWLLADLK